MNFIHLSYFIPICIFISLYLYFLFRSDRDFYSWIQDYWFYKRSLLSKLSTLAWGLGFSLICLALLDLRGPEKRIQGNSIDQKTIILIDSSASMLAEDVRPNRFNKALLLVKHYIKKAVGQQISLVVFSDSQKRIIPFTEDIDLIKARINRLETMNLSRGGTGLSQAIIESIQYFRNTSEDVSGNILIFTDAEETEFGFDIEIPDSISVGLVGVGTRKGAPIPMRNTRGDFLGNKKFQGKTVTTKLDEDFMKKLGGIIKNYQYWIATSYSIPTESILKFFNRTNQKREAQNEFRVRPVLTNYLLVPGILLLLLATMLRYGKIFVPTSLIFLSLSLNSFANQNETEEEKEPVKSERTLALELDFAKNELPIQGKKALAYNLLKDGFIEQSKTLYSEILEKSINEKNLDDYFNYALAHIQTKELGKGIKIYRDLLSYLEKYDEQSVEKMVLNIKKNVLKALEQQAGGGSGKNDNEKKDQEKNQNGQSGDQKNQSDKSDDQKQGKDQKKSDSKDGKDKDKKKKDQKNNDNKNKKKQKKNKGKGEKDKKVSRKKIPAILKQLISDDNNLQKKLIDAKTIERKTKEQKDW